MLVARASVSTVRRGGSAVDETVRKMGTPNASHFALERVQRRASLLRARRALAISGRAYARWLDAARAGTTRGDR
jgi:hypothetical protein